MATGSTRFRNTSVGDKYASPWRACPWFESMHTFIRVRELFTRLESMFMNFEFSLAADGSPIFWDHSSTILLGRGNTSIRDSGAFRRVRFFFACFSRYSITLVFTVSCRAISSRKFFARTSAPFLTSNLTNRRLSKLAAKCKGVLPS